MDENFIKKRLTELRMLKGVSARSMSLDIGQSKGYIAAVEAGHNLPSMTVFFYICEYLNISPRDFFDTELADPESYQELIANIKKLNRDQLGYLSNFVKSMIK
ncbi:MAG TPA: XRE family transcriptional regulator [Ruminococcaceae bacterium]|jgi:transcriptional regulator with XRE-family HTH domain|nr:XRE family transcriptional regulator [Oscillospiraceae bacterium]